MHHFWIALALNIVPEYKDVAACSLMCEQSYGDENNFDLSSIETLPDLPPHCQVCDPTFTCSKAEKEHYPPISTSCRQGLSFQEIGVEDPFLAQWSTWDTMTCSPLQFSFPLVIV